MGVGSDVNLANGVVHLIDDVIMPSDVNIGSYVATHDTDFKDLFGLLVLGKLFGPLETGGPYTLFAPTDAAFDNITAAITSLAANRTALGEVLKHHVVGDTWWSAGLTDGMTLTALDGAQLTVRLTSGG